MMTKEEHFYKYVNKMKAKLPLPSENRGDIIVPYLPVFDVNDYFNGRPTFEQIVFTKDITEDGIVIGWKLKESNEI
jgi:hypothetical protein